VSVKIRLKRIGRKKQPTYRIVVTESRNPRGGKVIESVGYYSPYNKDKSLVIDTERIQTWSDKGAITTDAVKKLIRRARRIAEGIEPAEAPKKEKVKPAEPEVAEVAETPPVEEPAQTPAEETVDEAVETTESAETAEEEPAEQE